MIKKYNIFSIICKKTKNNTKNGGAIYLCHQKIPLTANTFLNR